jgi:histidinol-phosphatase (PHP family)
MDYLILGQHFVIRNGKMIDVFRGLEEASLDTYTDAVVEGMETGYFRILAHPDVFLFNNPRWNEKAERVSRRIIETASRTGVFLEINANGFRRRKILNQDGAEVHPYPRKEFWNLVKEYQNVKILIGEDNHSPDYIGDRAAIKAREFAAELNLQVRERLFDV